MIFLDFDGVLFDTVKEAYAVAVIAVGRYESIDEIDFDTKHYRNFKKLRYLISSAWNYKYLIENLDINQDLLIIENNLIKEIESATKKDYESFENKFFNTRNYLKNEHHEKWFRLNLPFSFLNEIKFLFDDFKEEVYIVTTKDKKTVLELLNLEKINFNLARIFDKDSCEEFISKKNIIENLINKNEINIFVDDSDEHIKDCSKTEGLKCFQPEWGYIGVNRKTVSQKTIIDEINIAINKEDNV
jgi:hypothetical protein